MNHFGRVEGGVVREIIIADVLPPFHPDITRTFHIVPDTCQVGYTTTDNLTFSAPAVVTAPPNPLDLVTSAVKSLPVAKRTNPDWGAFIAQCILAIEHSDVESLAYLIDSATTPPQGYVGYTTADSDYLGIMNSAKQLFGLA